MVTGVSGAKAAGPRGVAANMHICDARMTSMHHFRSWRRAAAIKRSNDKLFELQQSKLLCSWELACLQEQFQDLWQQCHGKDHEIQNLHAKLEELQSAKKILETPREVIIYQDRIVEVVQTVEVVRTCETNQDDTEVDKKSEVSPQLEEEEVEPGIPWSRLEELLARNSEKTAELTQKRVSELYDAKLEEIQREKRLEVHRWQEMLEKSEEGFKALQRELEEKEKLAIDITAAHAAQLEDSDEVDIFFVSSSALDRLERALRGGSVARKQATWRNLRTPETLSQDHIMEAINVAKIPKFIGIHELVEEVGHDHAARLLLQGRHPSCLNGWPPTLTSGEWHEHLYGDRGSESAGEDLDECGDDMDPYTISEGGEPLDDSFHWSPNCPSVAWRSP